MIITANRQTESITENQNILETCSCKPKAKAKKVESNINVEFKLDGL